MYDYDDSVPSEDNSTERTSEALVAAVELEHRRREIDRRVDRLREEERALREVRDCLAAEEQILARRVRAAGEERDRLSGKVEAMTRRTAELAEEEEQLVREIAVLDRRCRDSELRDRELDEAIATAQGDLQATKKEISTVNEALEKGRAALARIDGRLATSRIKR